MLTIEGQRDKCVPEATAAGYRLSAEMPWVVQGSDQAVAELERALPCSVCERVGAALVLRFGNAVGAFDVPHLGRLDVYTGKWGEAHFEAMLADITRQMAALPFAAGTGAQLPYDRTISAEERVLYHALVYLRHLCSEAAAPEERIVPALRVVLQQPHRRFERYRRRVPLESARRVEPSALTHLVSPAAALYRAPAGTTIPLARALAGHLPAVVEETAVYSSLDVPENRFVKAFLGQATGIVDAMKRVAARLADGAFKARLLRDYDAIDRALAPAVRHPLWKEVGEMNRLPAESTVLQRRRGYRELFRHFIRLRMAARLPLDPAKVNRLLEIKDIAELYEIWCFFQVQAAVTAALGTRPLVVDAPRVDELHAHLPWNLRIRWEGDIELFYNLRFSRSRPNRHSYSLPLRPDIVLKIPSGPNAGFHIFDAKFRLRKLSDAVSDADDIDDTEISEERRGRFKHADLYKMHTYRDALAGARSVWILYPGNDFRFFDNAGVLDAPDAIRPPTDGVGAVRLLPEASGSETLFTITRNILRDKLS